MDITVRLSQRPEADALLGRDPLAVLVAMLLDQQVPMEWAFQGPLTIADRMGTDHLDARTIAAFPPERFAALLADRPAVHRYPGAMAKRIQQLAVHLVETYGGDAEAVWRDVPDGADLRRRLEALPGFGRQKAQMLTALLGKRYGVTPDGWREAAGPYGAEDARLSPADVTGPESLAAVRAHRKALKARAARR